MAEMNDFRIKKLDDGTFTVTCSNSGGGAMGEYKEKSFSASSIEEALKKIEEYKDIPDSGKKDEKDKDDMPMSRESPNKRKVIDKSVTGFFRKKK